MREESAHILLLLVTALLSLVSSFVGAVPLQQIDPLIVCIESTDRAGTTLLGSGFFVAPGVIATVAHQVQGKVNNIAYRADGTRLQATPILMDRDNDLALLQVDREQPRSLPLAEENTLPLAAEVSTIGCPHGLDHTLSRGVVAHSQRRIEGRSLIQTDLAVAEGSSGGPLLDQQGSVVGVIHGMLRSADQFSFAVPVRYLRKMMAQYYLQTGRERFEKRDIVGAERLFEQAYRYDSERSLIKHWYGKALYLLGQPERARDLLLEVLAAEPESADTLFELGQVYLYGLNEPRSARNSFQQFLPLSSNTAQSRQAEQWLQQILRME